MKRQFFFGVLCSVVIIMAGFSLSGCSSHTDLLNDVSGVWEKLNGDQKTEEVHINLAGESKTVVIDGQSYPAEVETISMDNFQVKLKVQNVNGEAQTWTIRQVWQDNGSDFNLALYRAGKKETLTPKS